MMASGRSREGELEEEGERDGGKDVDPSQPGASPFGGVRWRSRNLLAVIGALLVPTLVAAIVARGSASAILVYVALFAEADIVVFVLLRRVHAVGGRKIVGGDSEGRGTTSGGFIVRDRVGTLSAYIKWAADGSEYSRRELARMVGGIASHLEDGGVPSPSSDPVLETAFEKVVYPYEEGDDVESWNSSGTRRSTGRAEYLACLETISSRLEQRMSSSAGAEEGDGEVVRR